MGSGFAFKKQKAVRSVMGHHTHAADGVPILPGLSHFEMIPTIEVEAVTTSGKSKLITISNQTSSIVSAFKKRKEARNVEEHEALAPAGAKARLGQNISAMTLTIEVGAAVTLGRSSLNRRPTAFQPVECASKKLRAALSARVIAKAAVDGPQRRIPSGPCHSEMIRTNEEEAVLITGIWIASTQDVGQH